jgi:hypothetical protein
LSHGIVARRREDLGRWTLHVPRELLASPERSNQASNASPPRRVEEPKEPASRTPARQSVASKPYTAQ